MAELGYTGIGATLDFDPSGYVQTTGPWTMVEDGVLASGSVYLRSSATNTWLLRIIVYTDFTAIRPDVFVDVTSEITVPIAAADAWYTVNFNHGSRVTMGASYWIGLWFGATGGSPKFFADTFADYTTHRGHYNNSVQSATFTYASTGDAANWVDTGAANINEKISMYVNYVPMGVRLPRQLRFAYLRRKNR